MDLAFSLFCNLGGGIHRSCQCIPLRSVRANIHNNSNYGSVCVEGGAEGIHTRLLRLVRVFSCTPPVLHVPSRACPVWGTHTLPDLAPTVNLVKMTKSCNKNTTFQMWQYHSITNQLAVRCKQ